MKLPTHSTAFPTGLDLLHDPVLNKGTAFTEEEREIFGLHGLLPPKVTSMEEQVIRVLENFRKKPSDLEQYIDLVSLQDRNETLFYRLVTDHIEEMMPILYTPTVGKACQEYGHIFRRSRGIYLSPKDLGKIAEVLRNWPERDVRVIVVTDGERILGLGDLGANGMGIPVGKLTLYSALAGVDPSVCLPVTLDMGTNNESLLSDPLYIGIREKRLSGELYDTFINEFVEAVGETYPRALIQFEDFGMSNAFRLLSRFRNDVCCFNDDIQGTGSVALAGLYSALRITGGSLRDQKILFLGAGEAGVGVGHTLVAALIKEGLAAEEARRRCWYVDSGGLVVAERNNLAEHKKEFAHKHPYQPDFLTALTSLKPTVIIGASGQAQAFTRPVLETMARLNNRPIVYALSNPTSKSECKAEEAYRFTEGRAIFASGSPYAPVSINGTTHSPGQANNAYVFPGIGLGIICSEAKAVTNEMFQAAAKALAQEVSESDLKAGRIYPPIKNIRAISASIATAVAEVAYRQELARKTRPDDLREDILSHMYHPSYRNLLPMPTSTE